MSLSAIAADVTFKRLTDATATVVDKDTSNMLLILGIL
jgi:hypothetical protein